MREGIIQAATKIDPGFKGVLNWGFRNSAYKDFRIDFGDSLFKLTMFKLSGDEFPDDVYGKRKRDAYQNLEGIRRSARHVTADVGKADVIRSSRKRMDPRRELKEAGYPFTHISTELVAIDGKFEAVHSDMRLLNERFDQLTKHVDEKHETMLERVGRKLDRQATAIAGSIVGGLLAVVGLRGVLAGSVDALSLNLITLTIGVILIVLVIMFYGRGKQE